MGLSVKLSELMEMIDLPSEELTSYLNRKTGQILTFAEEEIRAAEEEDTLEDYPDWQQDNIRMARDFLENEEDYLALPTKHDLDEYRLMEKFSLSVRDRKASETLYSAIKGKGAFRRFRDALHRLNLTDHWYAYRGNAVRQIAINWCKQNEIQWQDN